jgi:copper homeostasis protein CutC
VVIGILGEDGTVDAERTGVRKIHAAAFSAVDGRMRYRNPRCFMGGELRPPEFGLSVTDPARIRALVGAVKG